MSRVSVRVRPATGDDVAALVEFVRSADTSAGSNNARPLQEHSTEHLVERFHAMLSESGRRVLIAAGEAGDAVGMLAARTDEVGAVDLTPVLHVTHLIVGPGHRRRGVGRSLLVAAVHLAEDAGFGHLLASAPAGSREGNRYLARIGFAPLVVHRIAAVGTLRRSLGMGDTTGRVAMLRRARRVRAQRAAFTSRAVGRGA